MNFSILKIKLIKKWSNESGEKLGDIEPEYFEGGYALHGSFRGTLIVKKGNMCFNGPNFNITIQTGDQ